MPRNCKCGGEYSRTTHDNAQFVRKRCDKCGKAVRQNKRQSKVKQ